jgi:hypothetical protein
VSTTFKSNVRLHACNDGDTGRAQLMFYVSEDIQKQFVGKRVEIKIVTEKKRSKARTSGGRSSD